MNFSPILGRGREIFFLPTSLLRDGLDGGSKHFALKGYGGSFISGCFLRERKRDGLIISHFLLVDDTIGFCEA